MEEKLLSAISLSFAGPEPSDQSTSGQAAGWLLWDPQVGHDLARALGWQPFLQDMYHALEKAEKVVTAA